MQKVHFSDGTTAEVENVRGDDPRRFTVPASSFSAFARAATKQATMQFDPLGPVYMLTKFQGQEGVAKRLGTRR